MASPTNHHYAGGGGSEESAATAATTTISRMINHVLDVSEKIVNVVEDGMSILLKGGVDEATSSKTTRSIPNDFGSGEEEEMMDGPSSPLEGIADSVLGNIMKSQARPETTKEHLEAFVSAINWTEPFIISLLVFHVIVLLTCIRVTRPDVGLTLRLVVMISVGGMVRLAEYFNRYGAHHWKELSCTQNYFDHRGIFMGIFFSGPLLLDSFIMLLLFLREASQLLIQVKKEEILKKKKTKQRTTTAPTATKTNHTKTTKQDEQKTPRRNKTNKEE